MLLFCIAASIFLIYVIWHEVIYTRRVKSEVSFLTEFDGFLSHVRHYYYYSGSAADAIYFSIPNCSKKLKPIMEELLSNIENGEDEYLGTGTEGGHRFVRMFALISTLVTENGDTSDGESVFTESLMQLRSDVQEEKRFIEGRRHRFTGLALTSALPLMTVPLVAAWGIDTIPSLVFFYRGRVGNLLLCAILAVSILCYRAIVCLRESGLESIGSTKEGKRKTGMVVKAENAEAKVKHVEKVLTETGILPALLAAAIMIPVLCSGHSITRRLLLYDVSDIDNISQIADGRQKEAMQRVIPKYTEDLYSAEECPQHEALTDMLLEEPGIRSRQVASDTATEIELRLMRYGKEHFDATDMMIVALTIVAVYLFPHLAEMFRGLLINSLKQDEIQRFQSLIHMQKRVPGISPVQILESMEEFAEIFRPALQQCINEFGVNDLEALKHLAESERYPDFLKLTDCFMSVDESGVEEAFDEVSAEIVNFKENRKLERSIRLDDNVMLASLLAVIPGGIILFGYLLIPFMAKSLTMFNMYQDTLAEYIES